MADLRVTGKSIIPALFFGRADVACAAHGNRPVFDRAEGGDS